MSILRDGAARGAAGGARLRARPWRGGGGAMQVVPAPDGLVALSRAEVERTLADLAARGTTTVYTTALGRRDRWPFLDAGFREVERLHLLVHPFDELPSPAEPDGLGISIRRARRRDRPAVVAVDDAAFDGFWHLDDGGISEALDATVSTHFRVATAGGRVVGYAVCGRAGNRGYVQRLAVHPDLHHRGIGRALLVDGIQWLARWGARDALVNTQEGNSAALRLYQGCGFVLQPDGLAVLRADLTPGATPPDPVTRPAT